MIETIDITDEELWKELMKYKKRYEENCCILCGKSTYHNAYDGYEKRCSLCGTISPHSRKLFMEVVFQVLNMKTMQKKEKISRNKNLSSNFNRIQDIEL